MKKISHIFFDYLVIYPLCAKLGIIFTSRVLINSDCELRIELSD